MSATGVIDTLWEDVTTQVAASTSAALWPIAVVVTPVGRLASPDFDVTINGGKASDVTMGIRKTLTDIQYGRAEDTYGWMQRVV